MDPVSITAAVVGLLTAAAKVSTTLTAILQRTSNAPKFAQNVLLEVSDISACLTQLRAFLDGARVESRSRATLILVDQVIVLLTTSMITFSELEKIVESLELDKSMGLVSKLRWSRKESAISSLLLRLQASKSSLNLMLTALTCTSIEEAQTAVGHFQDLIQQTLTNDEDISRRLANLETQNHNTASNAICAASITTSQNHDVSTENRWSQIDKEEFEASVTRTTVIEYAFESMLQRSRPYTRGLRRNSRCSRTSSVAPSMGWSFFSGVSLADISKTSVISLPIWKSELWNGSHYDSSSITNYSVGLPISLAPAKKIALLGHGKSTVFKQFGLLAGHSFTALEREAAHTTLKEEVAQGYPGLEGSPLLKYREELLDTNLHLMKKYDRPIDQDSKISNQDVLHSYVRTCGIYASTFDLDYVLYQMFDADDIRAWQNWKGSDYIMFVVPLPSYAECESGRENSMQLYLDTFRALITSKGSVNVPIFILLNKIDILIELISIVPIKGIFPDFRGDSSCLDACKYFAGLFSHIDDRPNGKLYIHYTNAVDTESFADTLQDIVLNLRESWTPEISTVSERRIETRRKQRLMGHIRRSRISP